MTLFWFVLGLALVVGIARYNESNKLFWALFCSLLIGVACGHLVSKCTATDHKMDKKSINIQMCPTHGLHCTLDTLSLANDTDAASSTLCKRVSKELPFEYIGLLMPSSHHIHRLMQLPQTLYPPGLCYTNTSTPLEREEQYRYKNFT